MADTIWLKVYYSVSLYRTCENQIIRGQTVVNKLIKLKCVAFLSVFLLFNNINGIFLSNSQLLKYGKNIWIKFISINTLKRYNRRIWMKICFFNPLFFFVQRDCVCKAGYELSSNQTCELIDLCSTNSSLCDKNADCSMIGPLQHV